MTRRSDEAMPDQGTDRDSAGVSPGRTPSARRERSVGPDGVGDSRDNAGWSSHSGDSSRSSTWDVPDGCDP